jgi:glycosyltransferase involved in cell wall biosynthesis
LEENHGLAYALNEDLKKCRNELVARIDSDDYFGVNAAHHSLKTSKTMIKPMISYFNKWEWKF